MTSQAIETYVGFDFGAGIEPIGRLAIRNQTLHFEYNLTFLRKGLGITPFQRNCK